MSAKKKFMERCIQLARYGEGSVAPNPMVGAVIVYKGEIIGEGYHRKCGEAHAEVNAIRSVKDEGLLKYSTLYVSLEPCSHYGKTPPCAKLIIEKKIPRVVIACLDPFPQVAGRGVQMLEEAGIQVTVGMMQCEALRLNERFIWFHEHKSPYVIAKWAQSADGYMDKVRSTRQECAVLLSSLVTQRYVHKLRTEVDAILVGSHTGILDNPSLSARSWKGKSPIRLVIDPKLSIPCSSHIYDGSVPTYIFTHKPAFSHQSVQFVSLSVGTNIVREIKNFLYQQNIQTLLVEGGAITLQYFFEDGVNEARVESTEMWLGEGIKAPQLLGLPEQTFSIDHSIIRVFKGYPLKIHDI